MKQRMIALLLVLAALPSLTLFADSYKDRQTGLSLPETLGGMTRKEVTDFEKDNPGLGVGVLYRDPNPSIYADIYIYDLGVKEIPNGTSSKIIYEQWKQAEGDVYTLEKRGTYQSVKILYEASSLLGTSRNSPTALRTDFSYAMKGSGRLSHLYLLGYKNHFIKIRFTYPEKLKADGERALTAFLNDFGKLISK